LVTLRHDLDLIGVLDLLHCRADVRLADGAPWAEKVRPDLDADDGAAS
jgi:hypothetical protein